MNKHIKIKFLLLSVLSLCIANISFSQSIMDSKKMESNFKNPPNSVKPKTWMHAMSGNMSKEGMTKDLEAIAAAGQGGILLFNVANGIPYGEVAYGSSEHHDILKHTAKECERLNLSFGVHNCDGWSSSGGPWVTPEESMKMVVYSETTTDGGKKLKVKLPKPTTIEGFYKDIAVLAYPALDSEIIDAEAKAKVTASDQNFDIALVTDRLNENSSTLTKNSSNNPWIIFDYGQEQVINSLYLSYFGETIDAFLETSMDGKAFSKSIQLKNYVHTGKRKIIISEQFAPIKARYFRVSFEKSIDIREINFTTTRPYNNYLGYSGLGKPGKYLDGIDKPNPNMIIDKASIINLSASVDKDGMFIGELPKGKWTIMRFGYTSTGAFNWPASKWGKGLECDKFSRPAFKNHFDAFAKKVIDNSKDVAPNALQYIEIDSYEMGGQNWTEGFESLFKKEKGYDIIPYLPIFAGRYVDGDETVAGFAYDINDLYCNLMTNNYFKYFTELCNKYGLKSYVEPYGNGPVSTLDASAHIDIPMTEFWMNRPQRNLNSTIMGAHIYGKNVVSAESFTSRPEINWKMHPAMAKSSGDMSWVTGINEFMFHRFVHQANTHVKPGLTMGYWGSHIDRTQHWWMNAGKSWFNYIARGSYLLREGYPVADVLVFMGDGPHKSAVDRNKLMVKLPEGINYDCTNADALLNRLEIKNKTLVLPEGNAYSYLILQDIEMVTLPTLRRIKEIVDAGIPVIGKKPIKLAGLNNLNTKNEEFNNLVDAIWSTYNCTITYDFSKVQADLVFKDNRKEFMHRKSKDADIYFFYNEEEKAVMYEGTFRVGNKIPELWNPDTGEITKIARFKTNEKETQVWLNLKSLESAFIVFRENAANVVSIIEANDTNEYFLNEANEIICLSNNSGNYNLKLSNGKSVGFKSKINLQPIDLSTSWDVEFLEEHDYKAKVKFEKLTDWKDHSDENIKYYSGKAIYRKDVTISKKLKETDKVILDLGNVSIAAEVIINGKNAGVLWIAPFTLDISKYVVKGKNTIEIHVFNQWTNRLIGDERFPKQDGGYMMSSYNPKDDSKMPDWYVKNEPMPKGPRTTFSSWDFYKNGDELISAGLLGPVTISFKQEKSID